MKKYKVIQLGTGNTGMHALRGIIQHPDLELVGLWVHSPAKAGQDAGELCGLGKTGVKPTTDINELISLDADCACYMKAGAAYPTKPGSYGEQVVNEIRAFLESGKNIVGSTSVTLVYPYVWGPEFVERLEKSCQKGRSTFLWGGIDPGFMCDELPLILSSTCERIDSIRGQEILCYGSNTALSDLTWMGFGAPLQDRAKKDKMGDFHAKYWCAPSIRMVADALDVKLDEIRGTWDGILLEEDLDIPVGKFKAGTVGAVRFEVAGIVGGKPRIFVEHVTRLRNDLAPQWPQLESGGYRVIIEGSPSMRVDLAYTGKNPTDDSLVATASRLVNSIPVACDADPGIRTFLNVPRQVMGVHRMKV